MVGIADIPAIRIQDPDAIRRALANRIPAPPLRDQRKHMIIACDHPARGALGAGENPAAMADRGELLRRCATALSRPGVTGFLGTADMIEDLALIGALDGKHVFGSMNRGGLQGASFEIDDRYTCYSAADIDRSGLDGGKALMRIDLDDPATVATLESTAKVVDELAATKRIFMLEPFMSTRVDGRVRNDLSADAVIKSIAIASGLGSTSAYTWLKLPCVDDMERVMASTTLPSLILGGEVARDVDAAMDSWGRALSLPNVFGLVIGRSLLFPADSDVENAVDQAVELL